MDACATALRLPQALRASRLFGALGESTLARLASASFRRTLVRGERLWSAGEQATHFFVITSGLMKIVRSGDDGGIVTILGARESLGDAAVLGRHPYPADAYAATETAQVVGVRAEVVLGLSDDAAVSAALQRALLQHTALLQSKIAIMSAGSMSRRLAALFSHLADRFGDESEDGSTIVPVALSRSELAHLVGATVETTIRIVSAWQKAGLLTTNATGFVLRGPLRRAAAREPASQVFELTEVSAEVDR